MTADPDAALAAIDSIRRYLGEHPSGSRHEAHRGPTPTELGRLGCAPNSDLAKVLVDRRSHYCYAGAPADDDLAGLLRWGCGSAPRNGVSRLLAPSAGGHDALDVFVLSAGKIQRYNRFGDTLDEVAHYDREMLSPLFTQPEFGIRVETFLAISADPRVGVSTYGARHYRTLHIDAGVLAAHCSLVAEALGLASCIVSGFDDDAWHRLLHLDAEQFVGLVMPVGKRPPAPGRSR
ncbi:nitroreductase family protein [Rhodococcoides kyotonense]|uniref:SagB-type dehydrogenase domain-containing protein n=1 Tax=Rhodococcoides kyotonense TaxID=398843 RepID=A0A239H3A2_9NOCA|nr:nitroreductase family protein [Rhodococcus kyotonensis]SNS75625.1 SagB-type dehydrogenase domain-containing protein [Rhodococcus kyotonensis]